MPSRRSLFSWLGPFLFWLALSPSAHAKEILVTLGERVTVFTGPGKVYRPLTTLSPNTEVQAGSKTVKNKRGEFYKVLVQLSNRKKAIGYIPVDAPVKKKSDLTNPEDMESFADYPLAEKSIQLTYAHLKSQTSLASVGLMRYIGPGFYWKFFAGALKNATTTNPIVGGGFGNDALLAGKLSGFIDFGVGVFVQPKKDALFPGSKEGFSNFMVQTAIGVRYNFSEVVSLAIGPTQGAVFNANNSFVTWGALASLEWGL